MESLMEETRISSRCLDAIIDNLDEFDWVELIDEREEIHSAYFNAVMQLGVLVCLWNLHLVDYELYDSWVSDTYKAIKQLRTMANLEQFRTV